ncbi:MAG: cytochrome P450 [Cyanobium sp. CACIAM 14]|nr:MAG: cytochrome P450 [Cyanobium sp. CACIAM 14]
MATTLAGPTAPAALQRVQWILDPVGYMGTHSRRFGGIFPVRFLPNDQGSTYLVSDPKALQAILSNDAGRVFSAPGELNAILAPLLGRRGTILLSGEEHRQRRQLLMPRFHGEVLEAYGRAIATISREQIADWGVGEVREMRPLMQRITMRIILQVVFGLDQGERALHLDRLLSRRLELSATPLTSAVLFLPWLVGDYGPWSPGTRLRRLGERIDALLFAEIQERRARGGEARTDVLSLLLHATDAQGQGLSDLELRDELMTLLVAGHETTATALTAALHWLHRTPGVLERLREELADLPSPPEPAELLRLPYLGAVCQESLRLHPVAMVTFPRRVEAPVECGGQRLVPGDLVLGCIYLLHRREELYPEPESFRPERFLERPFSPYEYMPFGGGVRRCIGSALAQQELRIVLGTLLRHRRLEPVDPRPVAQARRGVTLGLSRPVRLRRA